MEKNGVKSSLTAPESGADGMCVGNSERVFLNITINVETANIPVISLKQTVPAHLRRLPYLAKTAFENGEDRRRLESDRSVERRVRQVVTSTSPPAQ